MGQDQTTHLVAAWYDMEVEYKHLKFVVLYLLTELSNQESTDCFLILNILYTCQLIYDPHKLTL